MNNKNTNYMFNLEYYLAGKRQGSHSLVCEKPFICHYKAHWGVESEKRVNVFGENYANLDTWPSVYQ